ncbi:hypothetical protein ACOME3_002305 [Neoechinorhynchus agilis]
MSSNSEFHIPIQNQFEHTIAGDQKPPPVQFYTPQPVPQQPLSGWHSTAPMMNIAKSAIEQYKDSATSQYIEMLTQNKFMDRIRRLFDVDIDYVFAKITMLLFPFTFSSKWSYFGQGHNEDVISLSPRQQTSSPDLYIPALSLISFTILGGVMFGLYGKFSPEVLGAFCTSALFWLTIEQLTVNSVIYLFNIPTANLGWIELLAFCGYKYFVSLICCLNCIIFPKSKRIQWIVYLYSTSMLCYFMIRTLKACVLTESVSIMNPYGTGKKRVYLLLGIALSQPVLIYLSLRPLPI